MRVPDPRFLSVADVRRLHGLSIERYGGILGLRDEGLLISAVATPAQTFGDTYLHPTLAAMAGAYLFHLCRNHPFLDGNKRTALLACEAFLRWNGHELTLTNAEAEALVLQVARGRLSKDEMIRRLEESVRPFPQA